MAASGRRRLGGPGQRGDAAADTGGPGGAGLAGLAGPLAHPGRPGRRVRRPTSSAPGASSATRAGRCACARPRPPSIAAGTAASCPPTSPRWRRCPASAPTPPAPSPASATGSAQPVVDTNVRRVVARLVHGRAEAGTARAADLADVAALAPADPERAVRFSVAVMELGALVCVAGTPRCGVLPGPRPVRLAAGRLARRTTGPPRRVQKFAGTDRQVRGRLLDVLRAAAAAGAAGAAGRRLGRRRPAVPLPGLAADRRPGRADRRRPLRPPRRWRRLRGPRRPGDDGRAATRGAGDGPPSGRAGPTSA